MYLYWTLDWAHGRADNQFRMCCKKFRHAEGENKAQDKIGYLFPRHLFPGHMLDWRRMYIIYFRRSVSNWIA